MSESERERDLDRDSLGLINMMIHVLKDDIRTTRATLKGFERMSFVDEKSIDSLIARLNEHEGRLRIFKRIQEVFREAVSK